MSMANTAPLPSEDPAAAAAQAAGDLAARTGATKHDIALVLGSGWLPAVDLLGETLAEFPSTDLHGFAPPAVAGHAGTIRSIATSQQALGRPVHALQLNGVLGRQPGIGNPGADIRYRDYWHDELHPTSRGYAVLAKELAGQLSALGIKPA